MSNLPWKRMKIGTKKVRSYIWRAQVQWIRLLKIALSGLSTASKMILENPCLTALKSAFLFMTSTKCIQYSRNSTGSFVTKILQIFRTFMALWRSLHSWWRFGKFNRLRSAQSGKDLRQNIHTLLVPAPKQTKYFKIENCTTHSWH